MGDGQKGVGLIPLKLGSGFIDWVLHIGADSYEKAFVDESVRLRLLAETFAGTEAGVLLSVVLGKSRIEISDDGECTLIVEEGV
tara:strand:+ start:477 stop:728 length:252 start_codon:yes stop_codon:yes gene_type:complete